MKKIIFNLMAILISANIFAERVSQEEAALIANHFMNVAATTNGVRQAAPAKRMVLKTPAAQTQSQYYIYENENGEGWVIIAANDAVTPVLAYSETGYFRTDNMPSNLRKWMDKYERFIARVETDSVVAGEEAQTQWRTLRKGARQTKAAAVVGPLIQTQWDQDEPYNDLCPGSGQDKAYTGCVATAMAQVMNYWQWPKTGNGSRTYQPVMPIYDEDGEFVETITIYPQQSADFEHTTYDWANMKTRHYASDTQAQKTAIATLMYHCGVATDMMYGGDEYDGSGTYTSNYGDWDWADEEGECAQNALYLFFRYQRPTSYMRDGYSYEGYTYYEEWTDEDWTAMIKAELDKHHPILYGGASEYGGHSFICDGYDNQGKFHFNWGWSGANDGYFTLSHLVPGGGGAGGGGYDFSEDQDVIIGIVPDSTGYVPTDTIDPVDPVDPTPGTVSFTLLTNINNLAAGDEVILVNSSYSVAAGTENSSNKSAWMEPEEVTISNNQITLGANSNAKVMTIGRSGNYWTFTNNSKLLVATAAKKVKFAASGASNWTVTIDTNGDATIQNETSSYGRFLYNVQNERFTTYTSDTSVSMLLPQLYVRKTSTTSIENTTITEKAVKRLENGQIVIVRGNGKYSIFGQKIQ